MAFKLDNPLFGPMRSFGHDDAFRQTPSRQDSGSNVLRNAGEPAVSEVCKQG
jgi:hypothetical protein